MTILTEKTIPYKTYVKRSLVEALRTVFDDHPDKRIAKTKITIEYPTTENAYPAIIVRFFERGIHNAGVGHVEYIYRDEDKTILDKYRHYMYDGDIEFAIYALSSLDRDLIADALIQTLATGDVLPYTNQFLQRIYDYPEPIADWNYVNVNTDRIQGYGETQSPAPWLSEDQLAYSTSYRVGISGEFYSLTPSTLPAGVIESVNVYPYIGGVEPIPEGSNSSTPWE